MFEVNKEVLEETLRLLETWDFSLTIEKLQEEAYAGWNLERAKKAELGYKRYLAVTKASGGHQPVPNGDIDRFWHEHILDTRRYARDCDNLFGSFLHHYPFFGMRGEADKSQWLSVARDSNDTWVNLFGEPLYALTSAQKCPQSCPNSSFDVFADAQKCPQSCPNPSLNEKPLSA